MAGAVHVFLFTNRFKENELQYNAGITVPMAEATDDTSTLTVAALNGLAAIFRSGFRYKKTGVLLTLQRSCLPTMLVRLTIHSAYGPLSSTTGKCNQIAELPLVCCT